MPELKTLSLVKGQHHFCFRYEVGDESKVLDALVEMVNQGDSSFDWFDAAVMSHQLGQHLAKELKAYLPKKLREDAFIGCEGSVVSRALTE